MYEFRVVPLCEKQLRDVDKDDILCNGLYRKCNVYKSGGGYDLFPRIAKKRLGIEVQHQFVVQLYGCNLRCPYCYVTPEGIWGEYQSITTSQLIEEFKNSEQEVFHLMGGAPALVLKHWVDIVRQLPQGKVFTSDLMLSERYYDRCVLEDLATFNSSLLLAVNIKGWSEREYLKNTGRIFRKAQLLKNLKRVKDSKVNFYLTFTNVSKENQQQFFADAFSYGIDLGGVDSFSIDLIQYAALD